MDSRPYDWKLTQARAFGIGQILSLWCEHHSPPIMWAVGRGVQWLHSEPSVVPSFAGRHSCAGSPAAGGEGGAA